MTLIFCWVLVIVLFGKIMFEWIVKRLRVWMRNYSTPKSMDEAEANRSFYSKIYLVSTVLLLASLLSSRNIDNEKMTEKLRKGLSADKNVKVVTLELFKKTPDITYCNETQEIETETETEHKENNEVSNDDKTYR